MYTLTLGVDASKRNGIQKTNKKFFHRFFIIIISSKLFSFSAGINIFHFFVSFSLTWMMSLPVKVYYFVVVLLKNTLPLFFIIVSLVFDPWMISRLATTQSEAEVKNQWLVPSLTTAGTTLTLTLTSAETTPKGSD